MQHHFSCLSVLASQEKMIQAFNTGTQHRHLKLLALSLLSLPMLCLCEVLYTALVLHLGMLFVWQECECYKPS